MPKLNLDILDKDLIRLLKQDGRVSTAHIANKLEVTTPTVRSRMKALIQAGILRVAGLVNLSAVSEPDDGADRNQHRIPRPVEQPTGKTDIAETRSLGGSGHRTASTSSSR